MKFNSEVISFPDLTFLFRCLIIFNVIRILFIQQVFHLLSQFLIIILPLSHYYYYYIIIIIKLFLLIIIIIINIIISIIILCGRHVIYYYIVYKNGIQYINVFASLKILKSCFFSWLTFFPIIYFSHWFHVLVYQV